MLQPRRLSAQGGMLGIGEEVAGKGASSSREDSNAVVSEPGGGITRVVECRRADFEKQPVLRIHQSRFLRCVSEERGIKSIYIRQSGSSFDVSGIRKSFARH